MFALLRSVRLQVRSCSAACLSVCAIPASSDAHPPTDKYRRRRRRRGGGGRCRDPLSPPHTPFQDHLFGPRPGDMLLSRPSCPQPTLLHILISLSLSRKNACVGGVWGGRSNGLCVGVGDVNANQVYGIFCCCGGDVGGVEGAIVVV